MGGVVKAVSSVVSGVGNAISSVASGVGSAVSSTASGVDACGRKTVSAIGTAVSNVIKNPLPVIEAIAVTAAIGPQGLGLLGSAAPIVEGVGAAATVVDTGATIAAGGAAISAAAVKAMNGGNVGDIATAAITSGVGSYAGQAAGTAIGADTTPGQLTTLGKITASAVGGSTTTTLKQLADGSSLSDAVSAGAKTFAAAGITTGSIEGLKAAFDPSTAGTAPVEERSVMADTGAPAPDYGTTVVDAAPPVDTKPTIGPTEEKLLASALYPAVYSTLFGKQQQAPISAVTGTTTTQAPTQQQPISPVQTTAGPGTQALAQALRIGDAGAPIFGGDKEGGKKAGWNVESLRYMGNSEA